MWLHAPLLCCSVYCLQVAFRRGSARSYDHAQLVHRMWLHAAVERLDIHVVRVATDDNLADLPSRQVQILLLKTFPCSALCFPCKVFRALHLCGAAKMKPVLEHGDLQPEAWEELQERWRTH